MDKKKLYSTAALGLAALLFLTYIIGALFDNLTPAFEQGSAAVFFSPTVFLNPLNYLYGLMALVIVVAMYAVMRLDSFSRTKKSLLGANSSKTSQVEDSSLENSRFMNDKERDFNFAPYEFDKLTESKKDGIPVRAVYDKKGLHVLLMLLISFLHIGIHSADELPVILSAPLACLLRDLPLS